MNINNKETENADAIEHYRLGCLLQQAGQYAEAMNQYMLSAHLDPEGPAVVALEMLKGIFGFYHRDAYNP